MIVYHGGSQVVSNPDLNHSRKAVDFGSGFYVTQIESQARSWAEKRKRKNGVAVISSYEFDNEIIDELKVLRFESYSVEWLDFIVGCRSLKDLSDWDIVIGGVANDKVFDTLELFFEGLASKEQTTDRLRMETPNMQMCFRTENALEKLKFLGGEQI
jgi:hypothetical protein